MFAQPIDEPMDARIGLIPVKLGERVNLGDELTLPGDIGGGGSAGGAPVACSMAEAASDSCCSGSSWLRSSSLS